MSDIPVEVKPGQFVAKKSKAAAKKGPGSTQWAILKMSGIPEEDIPLFRCVRCVSFLIASEFQTAFSSR